MNLRHNILLFILLLNVVHAFSQCVPPVSPTGNDGCRIGAGTVDLSASGSTGEYNWYDASTGGNYLGSGANFTTPIIATTTNYYVAATPASYALQFDGNNDYVALNMAYTTAGEIPLLTVEAWVNTSFSGGGYNNNWAIVDFDRSDYYNLFVRGDNGQVGFSTYASSGGIHDFYSGTGNEVNDGEWHHIAAVYDGVDKVLYVDGIEVARSTNPHSGNALGKGTTRYGFIGDGSEANSFNGGRNNIYYDGEIDELRIWHGVRTPGQLSLYKDSCLAGTETNLTAYYNFNEGAGLVLNDVTGNGNTGTLFNFPAAPWTGNCPAVCTSCESIRTLVAANVINPGVDLGADICSEGPSVNLDAGAGYASYNWSTGESSQTISVSNTGVFWVEVDNGSGCMGADTIAVSIVPGATANDTCLWGTGTVDLIGLGGNGKYRWYDAASGGTLLAVGDTFTTPVISSTTNYYVSSFDTATSLTFDGTEDYVALNMSYGALLNQFTVEAWVKTSFVGSSYNDNWAIVDFDRSEFYNLYVRGDNGQVGFSTSSSGGAEDDFSSGAGTAVNDGQWHHIVAVFDGTDKIIYIDGAEVARNVNAHGGALIGKTGTRFGFIGDGSEANSFNGGRNNIYFDGSIDEVRIWSDVRTPAEITANMNQSLTGSEAGLLAYYNMDEAGGNILTDVTGNGNDGTLFNMDASVWTENAITKQSCESSRYEVTVNVATTVNMDGSQLSCGQPSVTLDAGAGFSSYLWNTGETTQTINVSNAGIYSVDVSGAGCSGSDTTSVVGFTSSESALVFDGNNDYVAVENFHYDDVQTEMTLETWVKTSDGGNQMIASYDRSEFWRVEINGTAAGTGQIGFGIYSNGAIRDYSGSTRIDDGEWHHVACVFDNGAVSIYVDGVLDFTGNTGGATFGKSGVTRYGFLGTGSEATSYNGTTGPANYLDAELDEFRLWNVARSQAEIRAAMCTHISGGTSGLELYYKFDESSVVSVNDYSMSNINDGNLINFGGTPKITSGAPIGDLSSLLYTGSWSGQSVNLASCANDNVTLNEVLGSPDGIHLYYVNQHPNSNNGIYDYNANNYIYGSFVVNGTSPTYNIDYNYPNHSLYNVGDEDDLVLVGRADNSVSAWDTINSSVNTGASIVEAEGQTQKQFLLDRHVFVWDGSTSTDWATASNWEIGVVPYSGANVRIPNVVNKPILDANREVGNMRIEPSSLINLNGFRLSVYKKLTAQGSINSNGGEVSFLGSKHQDVEITGYLDLDNVTVNNGNGVSLMNGGINISGTLTLTNGLFNTNNEVVLLSNATGTARIAEITGGSITGDVTMQRYIDAGETNWRFLSSAISGTTLADYNDDFITSGFVGSDHPDWPSADDRWPSIYFYDETVGGVQDNGYVAATNVNNTVQVGEGLWVWCGDTITGTQPFTIDITGPVNTGNVSLPVSYTNSGIPTDDGWNMVGNPYPSTIDWDSPNITSSGINNAIYIWNPDNEQFASYIGGIGINGGSRYIASTQAFWVQANTVGASVQIAEGAKSAIDATFIKQSTATSIRFKAENANGTDEMVINFNENATVLFDDKYDARKLGSVNVDLPYLAAVVEEEDLSINQLPQQGVEIPVKLTSGNSGIHSLLVENAESQGLTCLQLEDVFTGQVYDLLSQSEITIYVFDTTTVARFILHVGSVSEIETKASCFEEANGEINVNNLSSNEYQLILENSVDEVIFDESNLNGLTAIDNLEAGEYQLTIIDGFCTKVESVEVSQSNDVSADFNMVNQYDLTFSFTSSLNNVGNVFWEFGDGISSNELSPTHTYSEEGVYEVILTAYGDNGCVVTTSQMVNVQATGINEADADLMKLYSTNGLLRVDLMKNHSFDKIEVFNSIGELILQQEISNEINLKLYLPNVHDQILLVKLSGAYNTIARKVSHIME